MPWSWTVKLVGFDSHDSFPGAVRHPRERHRGAGRVPGNVGPAASIPGIDPHMMVDVEAGVRPREHGVRDLGSEESLPDKGAEHRPAERLREDRRIVEAEW